MYDQARSLNVSPPASTVQYSAKPLYAQPVTLSVGVSRSMRTSRSGSLAKYFRDEVVSTFRIATTNECRISAEKVDCHSNLLPGYSQTYLSLAYTWRQTEIDLELAIRRNVWFGAVKNPQLGGNHVEWIENAFDCLVSIAECGSALPQCAVRR